jgi:hypothetical protein
MNTLKIGIIIGSIIVIFIVYKLYIKYMGNRIVLKEGPQDAKNLFSIPMDQMKLSQPHKGLSFSTSMWIYVKNWNYRFMQEKTIFNKGGFKLLLGNRMNDLYLEMPVLNSHTPEKILKKDIPLQKWVHIVVSLENRHLDLWLNGKLYNARHLKNLPKIFENKEALFCDNGGFAGYISRVYHYENPLTKGQIISLFRSGPINYNPIIKIKDYFKKLSGSVKFDIKIDADISTD